MTDRPILFSGPMVRALLAGTKTQTRRVLNPSGSLGNGWPMYPAYINGKRVGDTSDPGFSDLTSENAGVPLFGGNTPVCPGDRLYVREAWRTGGQHDHIAPRDLPQEWAGPIGYVADEAPNTISRTGRFRQGMHMPRWASRLTLIVTEVRVERLQTISEADAIAEGIEGDPVNAWRCYLPEPKNQTHWADPWESYRSLWDSLNDDPKRPGVAWRNNPWVVAYSFTVHRGNIDQIGGAS